jgi:transposase
VVADQPRESQNDQFDARTLAELLAADLVPRVWIGDEQTRVLRRLTSRRSQLVRARTRPKNEITAVLVRNLKRPPADDRPVRPTRPPVARRTPVPRR